MSDFYDRENTSTTGQLFTDASTGLLRQRRFTLTVVEGPDRGREHHLGEGTTMVGTHPNNDVVLTDNTVSRYHLELQTRRDGLRVTDLQSTNGTLHGRSRVEAITVTGSARLKLGKHTYIDLAPSDETVPLGEFTGDRLGGVLGRSAPMRALFSLLSQVAPTDATLLLQGETGTGKEAIAEVVHALSARRSGPLVVVDCGAIPHELIGSELFGHVRGAYTGATGDKRGLIEAANGGTLFLDEIGELALDLQPQLLRVLDKRQVRRIGDTRSTQVDIRVIAATHRDLRKMIQDGRFREDLYYRLAVVRAEVPPLRERIEDIPVLAEHFARRLGREGFAPSPTLMAKLERHPWPGNVRELRNVIERALSLGHTDVRLLTPPPEFGRDKTPTPVPVRSSRARRFETSSEMLDLPFKEAKSQIIETFERDYLTHLLEKHRGNISRAASEAGIDRNYIHRLVKKYDIDVPRE